MRESSGDGNDGSWQNWKCPNEGRGVCTQRDGPREAQPCGQSYGWEHRQLRKATMVSWDSKRQLTGTAAEIGSNSLEKATCAVMQP